MISLSRHAICHVLLLDIRLMRCHFSGTFEAVGNLGLSLLLRSVQREWCAVGDFFPWWFFGMAAGVEEPPEAAWSGRQSSRDLDVRAPYRAARAPGRR